MMFEIIQASDPSHYETAAILFREYANSLDFDLCFQNFDHEMTILHEMYGPPTGALFLVVSEGKYCGIAGLRRIENDYTCEVKRMYIQPVLQGKGAGKALLAKLIETGKEMGYSKIKLDTLGPKMPAAVHLYRSFDFQECLPYNFNPHEGILYFERDL